MAFFLPAGFQCLSPWLGSPDRKKLVWINLFPGIFWMPSFQGDQKIWSVWISVKFQNLKFTDQIYKLGQDIEMSAFKMGPDSTCLPCLNRSVAHKVWQQYFLIRWNKGELAFFVLFYSKIQLSLFKLSGEQLGMFYLLQKSIFRFF